MKHIFSCFSAYNRETSSRNNFLYEEVKEKPKATPDTPKDPIPGNEAAIGAVKNSLNGVKKPTQPENPAPSTPPVENKGVKPTEKPTTPEVKPGETPKEPKWAPKSGERILLDGKLVTNEGVDEKTGRLAYRGSDGKLQFSDIPDKKTASISPDLARIHDGFKGQTDAQRVLQKQAIENGQKTSENLRKELEGMAAQQKDGIHGDSIRDSLDKLPGALTDGEAKTIRESNAWNPAKGIVNPAKDFKDMTPAEQARSKEYQAAIANRGDKSIEEVTRDLRAKEQKIDRQDAINERIGGITKQLPENERGAAAESYKRGLDALGDTSKTPEQRENIQRALATGKGQKITFPDGRIFEVTGHKDGNVLIKGKDAGTGGIVEQTIPYEDFRGQIGDGTKLTDIYKDKFGSIDTAAGNQAATPTPEPVAQNTGSKEKLDKSVDSSAKPTPPTPGTETPDKKNPTTPVNSEKKDAPTQAGTPSTTPPEKAATPPKSETIADKTPPKLSTKTEDGKSYIVGEDGKRFTGNTTTEIALGDKVKFKGEIRDGVPVKGTETRENEEPTYTGGYNAKGEKNGEWTRTYFNGYTQRNEYKDGKLVNKDWSEMPKEPKNTAANIPSAQPTPTPENKSTKPLPDGTGKTFMRDSEVGMQWDFDTREWRSLKTYTNQDEAKKAAETFNKELADSQQKNEKAAREAGYHYEARGDKVYLTNPNAPKSAPAPVPAPKVPSQPAPKPAPRPTTQSPRNPLAARPVDISSGNRIVSGNAVENKGNIQYSQDEESARGFQVVEE